MRSKYEIITDEGSDGIEGDSGLDIGDGGVLIITKDIGV